MQTPQLSGPRRPPSQDASVRHPILDLPLNQVIKTKYALSLQHMLRLYTVGNLLCAWRSAQSQKCIEDVFDSPEQAHHAIATCAAWVGFRIVAAPGPVDAWWLHEEKSA